MGEQLPPTAESAARGVSRRTVVRTAAWSAPAVAVVVGIPEAAHASPGDSTLAVSWNNDSFRANSNSNMTSGTPNAAGQFAVAAMTLAVTGSALTDLVVTMESAAGGNGLNLNNNSVTAARGATTWSPANGSLTSAGWSPSPAIGSSQTSTMTLTQASTTYTGGNLKPIIGSLGNTDFPIKLTFTASNLAAPLVFNITTSASGGLITGSTPA